MQHIPAKVIDIDFSQPKVHGGLYVDKEKTVCSRLPLQQPTMEEKQAFVAGLQKIFSKSAVVSAFIMNQDESVTDASGQTAKKLPRTIMSYYDPRYCQMSQRMLEQESRRILKEELTVTKAEAEYLLKCTKLQSQSSTWFEHRKGRLTASSFRAICHTSCEKPSKSLIARILQLTPPPKSAALTWGIRNEPKARKAYEFVMKSSHSSFSVETTGLHVNLKYPYIGASPDGLTSCTCCGKGILEIKCPFSVRNSAPVNASCFNSSESGVHKLSVTHDYYYQIQGQMGIAERSFCDFVCWTLEDIYIERIFYDQEFFLSMEEKLCRFFVSVLFPRVLTGSEKEKAPHLSEATGVFCYCRKGEQGDMILCDSPNCKYGWFHFPCVNLSSTPTGTWFCPDCRH